jgi:hypothetical protein
MKSARASGSRPWMRLAGESEYQLGLPAAVLPPIKKYRGHKMTRRTLFNWTASGLLSHGLLARAQRPSGNQLRPVDTLPGAETNRKLKVVFVGAHVDDWVFCVGTLARYAREGHNVLCFSFTPGDSKGIADSLHMPLDRLAALRREDVMRGTKLFGSQLKILNQNPGSRARTIGGSPITRTCTLILRPTPSLARH